MEIRKKSKKADKIGKPIRNFIKQFDSFGSPISLLYKGSETFKTVPGGIITLLISLGIFSYFLLLLQDLYRNHTSTILQSIKYLNLATDTDKITMNSSNFDFAVRTYNYNSSYPEDEYDLYVQPTFKITELLLVDDGMYTQSQIAFDLQECGKGRFFNNSNFNDYKNSGNQYQCLKNFTFNLLGDFSNQQSAQALVVYHHCDQEFLNRKYPNQEKKCKSVSEINEFILQAQFEVVLIQQFFDDKEFTKSPIQTTLQNFFVSPIKQNFKIKTFGISQNFVKTIDSTLSNLLSNYDYTFIQSQLVDDFLYDSSSFYSDQLVQFQFLKGSSYQEVQRIHTTIWDILAETGGLMDIIFLITSYLISGIQRFSYTSNLIKHLYFIQFNGQQKTSMNKVSNQTSQEFSEEYSRQNLLQKLSSRVPANFTMGDFIKQKLKCFNSRQKMKWKAFKSSEERLENSLDVIKILNSYQNFRLIQRVILRKHQRKLLQFNMKRTIKSDLSYSDFAAKASISLQKAISLSVLAAMADKLMNNSVNSKIDGRLLKEIDDENQLVVQKSQAKLELQNNSEDFWLQVEAQPEK